MLRPSLERMKGIELTTRQLAELLDGRVVGDENALITSFSKIEEGVNGSVSFLANMKYEEYIYSTKATAVLVNEGFEPKQAISANLIYVNDAYAAIAKLMRMAERLKKVKRSGISWHARIRHSAKIGKKTSVGAWAYIGRYSVIGKNCIIYPQAYIGNYVTIGDDVTIFPGAKVMDGCVIGNRCVLHPGVVIGGDGFGFAPDNGEYKKIPQIGNVILEDDVDVGCNTCIDRATMGSTIIRKGVKLDNLIQIAHNVEIREHTVMAAQTGIAGSTKVGAYCMFGGQVGLVNHITVGSNVKIAAQTGVTKSWPDNVTLQGYPAVTAVQNSRAHINVSRLPELMKEVQELRRELEALKKENKEE